MCSPRCTQAIQSTEISNKSHIRIQYRQTTEIVLLQYKYNQFTETVQIILLIICIDYQEILRSPGTDKAPNPYLLFLYMLQIQNIASLPMKPQRHPNLLSCINYQSFQSRKIAKPRYNQRKKRKFAKPNTRTHSGSIIPPIKSKDRENQHGCIKCTLGVECLNFLGALFAQYLKSHECKHTNIHKFWRQK